MPGPELEQNRRKQPYGLQKCENPKIPVVPALEGLTSETDALAEFMSRPASSL